MVKKWLMVKLILPIAFPLLGVMALILVVVMVMDDSDEAQAQGELVLQVSPEVLAYRDTVVRYCNEYGISEYVDYILAIMEVETKGQGQDVMQSGGSTPEESIQIGCRKFADLVERMRENGCDLDTVLQSYNYGGAYMDYVLQHGRKHTFALAESFAKDRSGGAKVTYSNPIAVEKNGGWRYAYGNMFYVDLIHACFVYSENGGTVAPGIAGTIDRSERMRWLFPNGVPTSQNQMSQYLTTITVPIVDHRGTSSTMQLTVHKKLANEYIAIFQEMKAAGFPVRASDTAAYVWRTMATDPSKLSYHSYGSVVDLNWTSNPLVYSGTGNYKPGVDPYSITPKVVAIWKRHGFYWGGDWSSYKDYMHFTYTNN